MVFVPAVDALEASLVEGIAVIPVESFAAVVNHLRGNHPIEPYVPDHSISTFEPGSRRIFPTSRGGGKPKFASGRCAVRLDDRAPDT